MMNSASWIGKLIITHLRSGHFKSGIISFSKRKAQEDQRSILQLGISGHNNYVSESKLIEEK